MSKTKKCTELEFALSLIDAISETDDEPRNILENALKILDFGGLTARQMLDYMEAVR